MRTSSCSVTCLPKSFSSSQSLLSSLPIMSRFIVFLLTATVAMAFAAELTKLDPNEAKSCPTQCPDGCCPEEKWVCCADHTHCDQDGSQCPNGTLPIRAHMKSASSKLEEDCCP